MVWGRKGEKGGLHLPERETTMNIPSLPGCALKPAAVYIGPATASTTLIVVSSPGKGKEGENLHACPV